jgi:hypothetical protein
MANEDFLCDECEKKFSVGQGFLGSIDDFEFQMSDRNAIQEEVECSPFMNYVQLCNDCYSKRIEGNGKDKDKKIH